MSSNPFRRCVAVLVFLKKLMVKNQFINSLVTNSILLFGKFRTHLVIAEIKKNGLRTTTAAGIIRDIKQRYVISESSVCHVVATGWSLNDSRSLIESEDFVIGFNDACVSGLKFDLYFQEIASWEFEAVSRHAVRQIDEIIIPQGSLVYFKSVWFRVNNVSFMKQVWSNRVTYVSDVDVICLDKKWLRQTIEDLFCDDPIYLRQYSTSTLTSLVLAARAGFKKIVVHGLDFGGPYFFEMPEFSGIDHLKPKIFPKRASGETHETAHDRGVKAALTFVRARVNAMGGELYAGSCKSPSSQFLPIFCR